MNGPASPVQKPKRAGWGSRKKRRLWLLQLARFLAGGVVGNLAPTAPLGKGFVRELQIRVAPSKAPITEKRPAVCTAGQGGLTMNVKHSSCHHSRQAFLQRRAQRNARRFVRAMMNVGIGIGWDGKHLPLTSRLPARSRHHLVRLGAEIVRHLQHLAQPAAEPAAKPSRPLVNWCNG